LSFSPNPAVAVVDRGDNVITDVNDIDVIASLSGGTGEYVLRSFFIPFILSTGLCPFG
jgi:hypothetical protein